MVRNPEQREQPKVDLITQDMFKKKSCMCFEEI